MFIKILLWLTTYQKIHINKLNNKQHFQIKITQKYLKISKIIFATVE